MDKNSLLEYKKDTYLTCPFLSTMFVKKDDVFKK